MDIYTLYEFEMKLKKHNLNLDQVFSIPNIIFLNNNMLYLYIFKYK